MIIEFAKLPSGQFVLRYEVKRINSIKRISMNCHLSIIPIVKKHLLVMCDFFYLVVKEGA
jgi:hypothetical protein